jgi:hypothetical protein
MIERTALALKILGAVGRHGQTAKSGREFLVKDRDLLLG